MAYQIEAWESDGKGEARIASHILKRVADTANVVERFTRLPGCVRVTKTRTDGQDLGRKAVRENRHRSERRVIDLWIRPGYTSPF